MEKHIAFFMRLPFREKLAVLAFLLLLIICGGLLSSCFTLTVQRSLRLDGSEIQSVTIEPKTKAERTPEK